MPKNKNEIVKAEGEMNLTEIKSKSEEMQKMVDETKVTTDPELKIVADKIKNIKTLGKFVRQEMEKYTKPAQEIINNARTRYLPFEKLCKDAEAQLKAKANVYMTDIENKRRAKEDAIAKRAEKGNIKEETAVRKTEEIGEEKKSVSTDSSQIQRKIVQEIVIVDREKIPHEYWIVDEKKVRKVALAGIEIPGVEIRESSQIAIK